MQINQPLIWLTNIDDTFFIWTHGEKELEKFMSSFDSFTPNLKFTYESSKKDISFLDLKVSLAKGKLSTNLHIKATDCHQYLHYSSGHPEHTKQSIVYSQLIRVNRICCRENDFNRHKSNMKIWFQKRGYLQNIIKNEMKKIKFPSCNKAQRKNSKGIAFVVTYHPLLKQLKGILHRNMYLLNMNVEVKQTFTPLPVVSYRSSKKLSSYLVTAKLYPIERILGSKGCGKKCCEVCVKHKLDCDDKCLIYLSTCECCGKQYVRETTGVCRFRWKNYRCNDRKYTKNEDCFQESLFRHFHSGKHTGFLGNVKIMLIDKTDGQNHKKREDYWRRTLKTYVPFGLNVEDSV